MADYQLLGVAESVPEGNSKKSLKRTWRQLPRSQRYILTSILALLLLFWLFHYLPSDEAGQKVTDRQVQTSSSKSFLDKLVQVRLQPPSKVTGKPDSLQAEDDAIRQAAAAKDEDKGAEDFDYEEKADDVVVDSNQAKEEEDGVSLSKTLLLDGPKNKRQNAVVAAFQHAWSNYRKYAWGEDHLRPLSKSGHNWIGLGLTLVDSLDTMLVMNLKEEFAEARSWVENHLNFAVNREVNLFETTIRILGGLLSAFHLSGDGMFLDKAADLGYRLMGSFSSPSGIPFSDVNLLFAKGRSPQWSSDSSTSEVTTVQLEFRDLARSKGVGTFETTASKVSEKVSQLPKFDGLVPIFINPNTGKFRNGATMSLGARGDSYYEYLLKQWIQTDHELEYLKEDFVQSVTGILNHMAKRTDPNNLIFIGELLSGGKKFKPKMDELVCFLPGTLALAHYHGVTVSGVLPKLVNSTRQPQPSENVLMELAEELMYTCYLTFARQPTFLSAEINYFVTADGEGSVDNKLADFYVKSNDAHYLLRPETIESLWYLYYVTGNRTYQDWGWNIFQGIEKYTKVDNGYTSLGNVRNALNLQRKDMMESFFLGETLKYLYLLFADKQEFDLKKWVFNTEAHPLPVYQRENK